MVDILPKVQTDGGFYEPLAVMLVGPDGTYVGSVRLAPMGYDQYPAPIDSVTQILVPQGATLALIKVEGADMRYLDTGADPTPDYGMPLAVGETLQYDARMVSIRIIGQTAGAICNVSFYGPAADA